MSDLVLGSSWSLQLQLELTVGVGPKDMSEVLKSFGCPDRNLWRAFRTERGQALVGAMRKRVIREVMLERTLLGLKRSGIGD